jgi:hypothetical protein
MDVSLPNTLSAEVITCNDDGFSRAARKCIFKLMRCMGFYDDGFPRRFAGASLKLFLRLTFGCPIHGFPRRFAGASLKGCP